MGQFAALTYRYVDSGAITSARVEFVSLDVARMASVVTHELASIFIIGNNSVFLDAETRTMIAQGDPKELRDHCPDAKVRNFLSRGGLGETPDST